MSFANLESNRLRVSSSAPGCLSLPQLHGKFYLRVKMCPYCTRFMVNLKSRELSCCYCHKSLDLAYPNVYYFPYIQCWACNCETGYNRYEQGNCVKCGYVGNSSNIVIWRYLTSSGRIDRSDMVDIEALMMAWRARNRDVDSKLDGIKAYIDVAIYGPCQLCGLSTCVPDKHAKECIFMPETQKGQESGGSREGRRSARHF